MYPFVTVTKSKAILLNSTRGRALAVIETEEITHKLIWPEDDYGQNLTVYEQYWILFVT